MFKKIAEYYYTEESTRYLANLLLKNEDVSVVNDKIRKGHYPIWTEIAEEVLVDWGCNELSRKQLNVTSRNGKVKQRI